MRKRENRMRRLQEGKHNKEATGRRSKCGRMRSYKTGQGVYRKEE
jgi:hypothetical protein